MIAGALSVVLLLALAGDPPDPPTPDVAVPETAASAAAAPAAKAPAPALAPGSGSFVAVVRPATQDPLLQEASSRIRSELAASGLESQLVDCTEPTEAPCPGPDAAAAIALGRKDGVVEIDVRAFLPDGFELSRHVRVLDRDGGQDPSVLAVRAVELLRDLRLNAQRRAPAPPRGPAQDPEEPKPLTLPPPEDADGSRLRRGQLRWRLSTGVAALGAPAGAQPGFGPSLGAAIRGGAILGPRLTTMLTLAGPFNSSFSEPPPGQQASLTQALATLEVRFLVTPRLLQPFVAVLSGVNYLRETVSSNTPGCASTVSAAWVPLFGAGGGLSYDFAGRFSASVEAEVFATAPDELVEIDVNCNGTATVVARTGAPSILVTADLSLILP